VLAAIEDPKVNLFRGKKPDQKAIANLEQTLWEFISTATGGPPLYKGKDMKAAHAGMKITDDEFNALSAIAENTLNSSKADSADIKDFMAIWNKTRKDIVEVKIKN
jgi:hemoglobin